jgi:16S rRNA pseudouridine516 synthase
MPSSPKGKQTSLERILQSQGFGTRKACRTLIRRGEVSVDGAPVTDPSAMYAPEGLSLLVGDLAWLTCERVVLALHKPPGTECSRSPSHHDSVLSLLPTFLIDRGVQPVGRLDQDTTGLLLLTDDGGLVHAWASPKRKVPKTYLAALEHDADEALVQALLQGVLLHQEPAPLAASSAVLHDPRTLTLTITQGRYHQVKRMIAAAGNRCAGLHRTAVGGLRLASLDLDQGDHCVLSDKQIAQICPAGG